ncbi:MAG: hypothetical protein IJ998_01720 [Alistipes sp.]|nr:hypothetical protein [Alistipes sp.]
MAFDITALPAYVEQRNSELVYKAVIDAPTIERIGKQLGVKGTSAINRLNTNPTFQSGKSCGFDAEGDAVLSQRNIVTGLVKVNMEFCPETLIGTYAEYQVRFEAGRETMPFEERIVEDIIRNVNAQLETAVWQGDTTSGNSNLAQFDGFVKVIGAASGTVPVSVAANTSAWDAIKATYLAIPEAVLSKGDVKIFVSPAIYREFTQDLVAKNFFAYAGPQDEYPEEIIFPGTNVAIARTPGLSGVKKIYAGSAANFVFGTDMLDGKETFDLWYSQDNQAFRLAIKFNAGVQVAFPDEVVVATLA